MLHELQLQIGARNVRAMKSSRRADEDSVGSASQKINICARTDQPHFLSTPAFWLHCSNEGFERRIDFRVFISRHDERSTLGFQDSLCALAGGIDNRDGLEPWTELVLETE
jgi:hypothetical protein